MNINPIDKSLQAIQLCTNPKKDLMYLKVIGEGSNQYLTLEKISWFGRILIKLGIHCLTNFFFKKVADYVNSNISHLCQHAKYPYQIDGLSRLAGRIEKFNNRNSKKLQSTVIKINSEIGALKAKKTDSQTAKSEGDQKKDAAADKSASTSKKVSLLPKKGTSADPLNGSRSLHADSLKLLLEIEEIQNKSSPKKDKADKAEPDPKPAKQPHNATPLSPKSQKLAEEEKLKREAAEKAQKDEEEGLRDYYLSEFKSKKDAEDMDNLLKRLITPSESPILKKQIRKPKKTKEKDKANNGPKKVDRFPEKVDMKILVEVIQLMTPDEISKYAASEHDVFKVKEGTVFQPSLMLTAACATMSKAQIKAMVAALSKTYEGDLDLLKNIYYKIATLVPDSKFIYNLIVSQPKFLDSFQPEDVKQDGNEDVAEKENKRAKVWIEARLGACLFSVTLQDKNADNRLPIMRDSFLLAKEVIFNNFQNESEDLQIELAQFVIKMIDVNEWDKHSFMKHIASNPKKFEQIFQGAITAQQEAFLKLGNLKLTFNK